MINEVCPNPVVDHNGLGGVDANDRGVELYALPGTNFWLTGWLLADGGVTTLPQTKVVAGDVKVFYGADLGWVAPVSGTLTLSSPAGVLVDSFAYVAQEPGLCCARVPDGGEISCGRAATLGQTNGE